MAAYCFSVCKWWAIAELLNTMGIYMAKKDCPISTKIKAKVREKIVADSENAKTVKQIDYFDTETTIDLLLKGLLDLASSQSRRGLGSGKVAQAADNQEILMVMLQRSAEAIGKYPKRFQLGKNMFNDNPLPGKPFVSVNLFLVERVQF